MAQLRSRRGGRRYGGLGGSETPFSTPTPTPGGSPTPTPWPEDILKSETFPFPPPKPTPTPWPEGSAPGEIPLPPGLRDKKEGITGRGDGSWDQRGPQWFWDDFRDWMGNVKDWYFGDPFPYQEEEQQPSQPPEPVLPSPEDPPSGSWLDDLKEFHDAFEDWYWGE